MGNVFNTRQCQTCGSDRLNFVDQDGEPISYVGDTVQLEQYGPHPQITFKHVGNSPLTILPDPTDPNCFIVSWTGA